MTNRKELLNMSLEFKDILSTLSCTTSLVNRDFLMISSRLKDFDGSHSGLVFNQIVYQHLGKKFEIFW